MIENAAADLRPRPIRRAIDDDDCSGTLSQGRRSATSTAIPTMVTEMDAMIAYLQMLGTLVDFTDLRSRRPAAIGRADAMTFFQDAFEFAPVWVVWLMLLFLGVVAWAFWPKQQEEDRGRGDCHPAPRRRGRADRCRPRSKRTPSPASETTGHEWDGIKELNTPLPRWWLYTFYATIVWALVYWVALSGLAADFTGYTGACSATISAEELEKIEAAKARARQGRGISCTASPPRPGGDPRRRRALLTFALAGGESGLRRQLRALPRPGGAGGAAAIRTWPTTTGSGAARWTTSTHTMLPRHPQRGHDDDTRFNEMPAYGADEPGARSRSTTWPNYVLALSGRRARRRRGWAGRRSIAEHCAACHGEDRRGHPELGARRG